MLRFGKRPTRNGGGGAQLRNLANMFSSLRELPCSLDDLSLFDHLMQSAPLPRRTHDPATPHAQAGDPSAYGPYPPLSPTLSFSSTLNSRTVPMRRSTCKGSNVSCNYALRKCLHVSAAGLAMWPTILVLVHVSAPSVRELRCKYAR